MHEPIEKFPSGTVLGSCRLAKGQQLIDVTRVKHGSQTCFVESVTHNGRYGPIRTAFRRSDSFPSDKIADRFISHWLTGAVENRKYKVLHKDDGFDRSVAQQQEEAAVQ